MRGFFRYAERAQAEDSEVRGYRVSADRDSDSPEVLLPVDLHKDYRAVSGAEPEADCSASVCIRSAADKTVFAERVQRAARAYLAEWECFAERVPKAERVLRLYTRDIREP